jgi:hypothetical protein
LTHSFESDWFFKPLPLERQSWFQNVPFTFNLRRYNTLFIAELAHVRAALPEVGAVCTS